MTTAKARIYKLRVGLGGEKPYAGQWKVMVNYENDIATWGEHPQYFPVWQDAVDYAVSCVYPKPPTGRWTGLKYPASN